MSHLIIFSILKPKNWCWSPRNKQAMCDVWLFTSTIEKSWINGMVYAWKVHRRHARSHKTAVKINTQIEIRILLISFKWFPEKLKWKKSWSWNGPSMDGDKQTKPDSRWRNLNHLNLQSRSHTPNCTQKYTQQGGANSEDECVALGSSLYPKFGTSRLG